MAELYTYDGTHLTTVRSATAEFTQSADHGAVGTGSFVIDDTAGSLSIVGQKNFRHNESACSSNTLVFKGYVGDRDYGRNAGIERAPDVGASRAIQVQLVDLNDRLSHKLIQTGGKRPAETVEERLEWLLASDYAPFDDNGRVHYPNDQMDKADYRWQYAGDVLADCALAAGSGWNYFLADWGDGVELIFRNDNTSTLDSSSVRISNVTADIDSNHAVLGGNKTFAPSIDAVLHRSPENVHSKHAKSYAKGTVVENRAATATAFNGERGGTSSNSNIKRQAQAERAARRELNTHSTEEDVIDCTIQVPASAVNLVLAGWRIQAKFSHLATEGYGSFTWMRVLERTVRPMEADAFAYEIALKLVPQEAADPADDCTEDATASQTFYPLGDNGENQGIPAYGGPNVFYVRPGVFYPSAPMTNHEGAWHFPRLGAGGEGTSDYAGDCAQNELRFVLVGDGTLSVQTKVWSETGTRPMAWRVDNQAGDLLQGGGVDDWIQSGTVLEIEIADTSGSDCIRIVRISDGPGSCGGAWGWSSAEWVSA